jgi:hypothetical protein
MERDHAEEMLDRLYADRYDDVEMATVAFRMPVDKAIEELERKFPGLAKDFNDD